MAVVAVAATSQEKSSPISSKDDVFHSPPNQDSNGNHEKKNLSSYSFAKENETEQKAENMLFPSNTSIMNKAVQKIKTAKK